MTPPRSAVELELEAREGCLRYSLTFIFGWYFLVEELSHPVFEPIAAPFIMMAGGGVTIIAMLIVDFLGNLIRRIPMFARLRRRYLWLPEARLGAALLLYWISWWPWLRTTVQNPEIPTMYVDSYNRPLGLSSWLLLLFGIMNYTKRRELPPAPSNPQDGPIISEEAS